MTHKNNSPRRIGMQLGANTFWAACVLLLFCVTRSEANASEIFPIADEHRPLISASATTAWDSGERISGETKKQHTGPSLPGRPSDSVHASTALHHEVAADAGRSSLWIDQDTARFGFNLVFQGLSSYGHIQSPAGAVHLGSRSPVVPVSSSPSSGLLFATALVGMLGGVFRGGSQVKKTPDITEFEPHRPYATHLVVVLSSDGAFARDLEEHLHRAGHVVRVAASVSEIFTLTDPVLVLVDYRTRDWEMLRTDPSLRHVPLIAMVPSGCLYTEDHCISDLERGMDGIHDLRDGHRLLIAKVGAYLRRAGCDNVRRGIYQVGAVELDRDAHEVKIAGRQVKLSAKPFAILTVLMREPSKVFSRSRLFNLVWGPDFAVDGHALDVHVHALRQHLDREPNRLCELITIRRVGFTLKPVPSTGCL